MYVIPKCSSYFSQIMILKQLSKRLKEPLCDFTHQNPCLCLMDKLSVELKKEKRVFQCILWPQIVWTIMQRITQATYSGMGKLCPCHVSKVGKREVHIHVECRQSRLKHGQLHWMSTVSWFSIMSCSNYLHLSVCGSVYTVLK